MSGAVSVEEIIQSRQAKRSIELAFLLFWFLLLSVAIYVVLSYDSAPGAASKGPTAWPGSGNIVRSATQPTLIMFAHPKCPCTRASISELAVLMARCRDRLKAYVVFVKPPGVAKGWEKTDLWASAAAIPGVTVICDAQAAEAAKFGSLTSGNTLLYDTAGHLIFNGGITASRGHEGDNVGLDAIQSLVSGGKTNQAQTFAYGCPLSDPQASQKGANKSCLR